MNIEKPKILGLRETYFLLLLVLVSFSFRMIYTVIVRSYLGQEINHDETSYHFYASNLLNFGSYSIMCGVKAYYSPGFPVFLYLIYLIFGVNTLLAGFANCAVSALIPLFMYLTADKLFGKRTAALAALIACFYPYYIYYSPLLLTETLLTLTVLVSIYLLIKAREINSFKLLILSALLMGFSALIKPATILFPAFASVYLFLAKDYRFRKAALQSAVYFAVFFLIMSPWAIRNYFAIGTPLFTNTNSGKTFFGSNNFLPGAKTGTYHFDATEIRKNYNAFCCGLSELERDKKLFAAGIEELKKNWYKIPYLLYMKLIKFWSVRPDPTKDKWTRNDFASLFSYGIIFVFFLVGFAKTFKRREDAFIFHLTIIYFTLFALFAWGTPRFRLPISPFIIILAAAVIAGLIESHIWKRKQA